MAGVPGTEAVVIGDLTSIAQTRGVADQVNKLGSFDAVIHNAGIGYREPRRIATEDGLPHVFAVNTLAPYILTACIQRPKRLGYLSSELHQSGDATLQDLIPPPACPRAVTRREERPHAWQILRPHKSPRTAVHSTYTRS